MDENKTRVTKTDQSIAAVTRFNFYLGKFETTVAVALLILNKCDAAIVISNLPTVGKRLKCVTAAYRKSS